MNLFNLSGKTALVTGGGSGMGKDFARILAEAGATVMIASRNEARLKEAAGEINTETGAKVSCHAVDLSDMGEAENLIFHAQKVMGGLDILIGNAAMDMYSTADNFDDKEYEKMLSVNLNSNVWMTRAAVPEMKKNKWGRIIFITSIASEMGQKNLNIGLYGASKAALEAYSRYVAAELGTEGITVNCLAPGGVKTPMRDASSGFRDVPAGERDAAYNYISTLIPLNRFAEPSELAGTLLLLASNAGSYITGARYVVDGGWTSLGDTIVNGRQVSLN